MVASRGAFDGRSAEVSAAGLAAGPTATGAPAVGGDPKGGACADASSIAATPDPSDVASAPASRTGALSRAFDTLSERWDENPLFWTIAPLCVAAWEAMMFSRAAFLGLDRNIASSPTLIWVLFALAAASVFALLMRRRRPLATLFLEGALQVVGAWLGLLPYLYVPLIVALYSCVARAPWPRALGGLLAGTAFCLGANVLDALYYSTVTSISAMLLIPLFQCAVIGSLGIVSHVRFDRRAERRQAAEREAARQAELARVAAARDAALAKGRIAAELHDSVGHDLTAIIALSEGLAGSTGDAQLDHAISTINELARAGLADTRSAVRALRAQDDLAGTTEGSAGEGIGASLHRWDEIDGVLATVRATGIVAALSEVGLRTRDARQADLAFAVSREAVTNAMRHGCEVGRITVLWDHRLDGSCEVFVRDNGRHSQAGASAADGVSARETGTEEGPARLPGLSADDPAISGDAAESGGGSSGSPSGSPGGSIGSGGGLARLGCTVRQLGGYFEAGPAPEGGWCVHAVIPALCGREAFARDSRDDRR